jgi:hypothetical protein
MFPSFYVLLYSLPTSLVVSELAKGAHHQRVISCTYRNQYSCKETGQTTGMQKSKALCMRKCNSWSLREGSQAIELFLWLSTIENNYKISFFLKKIVEILSSSKVTAGKRHFSLKFLSPRNAPPYYTYKMLKCTVKISHDCSYMFRSTWTIIRESMLNLAKVTILWRQSVKIRC